MPKKGQKIAVGMSGGVDSSIALTELKRAGWEPLGVSLKYAVWEDSANQLRENVCCSEESICIAKKVCEKVGVPHVVVDVADQFQKETMEYFTSELRKSRTPNPCVVCNRRLKFAELFEWAHENDIDYVATGHFAKTLKNPDTGKFELAQARDTHKDQTYTLSWLTEKQLSKTIFPLGDMTKDEVYEKATELGFDFFEKQPQSQDFCFVAGKSFPIFLEKEIGTDPGPIIDTRDQERGQHKGLHFYTIGQRKGIQLGGDGPYYVIQKDPTKNALIVSNNPTDLGMRNIVLSEPHFISRTEPQDTTDVTVKIRAQHEAAPAKLTRDDEGNYSLKFDYAQTAITPGQFAVFYDQDVCLGCARIESAH
ncbi:tRNA 2-thiouridine(34) synthase MnmA [Patescibacteria group bacterium]